MLEIKGEIHDRYTLEFKIGYSCNPEENDVNDFFMDSWMFIPDALYINSSTYPKESFYRDVRTLVRLITPEFTLEQIGDPECLPLSRLSKWCGRMAEECREKADSVSENHKKPAKPKGNDTILSIPDFSFKDIAANLSGRKQETETGRKLTKTEKMYEHQIKMFCSIVRSAIRDEAKRIGKQASSEECGTLVEDLTAKAEKIVNAYRQILSSTGLAASDSEQRRWFDLGDEYLCRIIDTNMFRLMEKIKEQEPPECSRIIRPLEEYISRSMEYEREHGYLLPGDSGDVRRNRNFLYRAGQLKKYIESDLYILVHQRSNTFVLQQILFMIAAGLSMVFATVVSFSFQKTFGNFTMPLFIALVVSYMFKDRFKELLRYWFATKLGSKLYDYKIKLAMGDEPIGWSKIGCDFVGESKLPSEVRHLRGRVSALEAGNCALRENVLIFRQRLSLFGKKLGRLSHYPLHGVNEILRVNLREFLRRMDSSHVPIFSQDENGELHTVQAEKVYYIHFIMRFRYNGTESFRRFRVCLHRRGATNIEEW